MKTKLSFTLLLLLSLFSCQKKDNALILISKDSHARIEHWLKNIEPSIKTRVFYNIPKDSLQLFLEKAKGFVLGGGEDVNPELYHQPEYDTICEPPDNYRDSIELLMINFAMNNKIPILGICRGNQILNVANGGTLIPDIPTFIPKDSIQHRSDSDSAHIILPVQNSWIETELTYQTIWVNSHHHQAIGKLAPNFTIAAFAPDSIIESIEIKDKNSHPFAIGIQWHPESLHDHLSKQIGKLFIKYIFLR